MKIGVTILPKNEVLDTQGRAVKATLDAHGMPSHAVRVGKFIHLDIDAASESEALERAREMTEFVLYNPLIETFRLEVLKGE